MAEADCRECSQPAESHFLVTIMKLGDKVEYTIPSFPVYTAVLREIKYQFVDESAAQHTFDGYIRDCPSLDRTYPGLLKLCFGYTNAFTINPEEFKLSIDIDGKKLYDDLVFVIWKWSWEDAANLTANEESDQQSSEDSLEEDENNLPESPQSQSHSVVFKCVGVNKTVIAQEVLAESAKKLKKGEPMDVRLRLEPTNPKDSRAIAFDCKQGEKWEPIGYVIKEVLDDVHYAIANKLIICVKFDWIRYITHWSRSGPGWYCGIAVTKRGLWDSKVVKYSSTF